MVDPERAPIFVIGTGRSGTTLLRMMLNAHPRIYLTHEASFYLSRDGMPRHPTAGAWLDRYLRTLSFAWLRLSEADARAELARGEVPGTRADAVRALMRCMARRHGKARFGDKTPNHCLHLGAIFADHPEARVVHIVRDPRDAVASMDRMPWAASSTALNSLFCDQQVRAVGRFADRVHEVRLEDLMAKPRETMAAIMAFVGEPWDDAVLDHQSHGPRDDVPPFPWFEAAKGNVRPREAARNTALPLPPAWIRIVEGMNRTTMAGYGYAPARLEAEPTALQKQKARWGEVPEVLRTIRRVLRMVRLARRDAPLSAQMAALLAINPEAWRHYPRFVVPQIPGPLPPTA